MNSTRLVSVTAFVASSCGLALLVQGDSTAVVVIGAVLVSAAAIAYTRHLWLESNRKRQEEISSSIKALTSEIAEITAAESEKTTTATATEIQEVSHRVDVFTKGVLEYIAQLELDLGTFEAERAASDAGMQKRLDESDRLANKRRDSVVTQLSAILGLYHRFQPSVPFPPFGGWAIGGECAHLLVNLILTTRPKSIVEAGSGLSTVLMATALKSLGESGQIVSLEHDLDWLDRTRSMLEEHHLSSRVRIVHAPLVDVHVNGQTFSWYDIDEADIPHEIDLLFIDGPPEATGPLARYPAVPVLFDRLRDGATVVMDDAARAGEKASIQRWIEEFPNLKVRFHNDSKGSVEMTKT